MAFLLEKDQRAAFSWSVAEAVARSGIPVHQIDAGFEWAYWWYFCERYPVGEGPPGTLGAYHHISQRPYRLASAPLPGHEVVQTYMYTSFLGGRPRPLYLLRVTARPNSETR